MLYHWYVLLYDIHHTNITPLIIHNAQKQFFVLRPHLSFPSIASLFKICHLIYWPTFLLPCMKHASPWLFRKYLALLKTSSERTVTVISWVRLILEPAGLLAKFITTNKSQLGHPPLLSPLFVNSLQKSSLALTVMVLKIYKVLLLPDPLWELPLISVYRFTHI